MKIVAVTNPNIISSRESKIICKSDDETPFSLSFPEDTLRMGAAIIQLYSCEVLHLNPFHTIRLGKPCKSTIRVNIIRLSIPTRWTINANERYLKIRTIEHDIMS